jgi:hypothetical protein
MLYRDIVSRGACDCIRRADVPCVSRTRRGSTAYIKTGLAEMVVHSRNSISQTSFGQLDAAGSALSFLQDGLEPACSVGSWPNVVRQAWAQPADNRVVISCSITSFILVTDSSLT